MGHGQFRNWLSRVDDLTVAQREKVATVLSDPPEGPPQPDQGLPAALPRHRRQVVPTAVRGGSISSRFATGHPSPRAYLVAAMNRPSCNSRIEPLELRSVGSYLPRDTYNFGDTRWCQSVVSGGGSILIPGI